MAATLQDLGAPFSQNRYPGCQPRIESRFDYAFHLLTYHNNALIFYQYQLFTGTCTSNSIRQGSGSLPLCSVERQIDATREAMPPGKERGRDAKRREGRGGESSRASDSPDRAREGARQGAYPADFTARMSGRFQTR